MENELKKKGIIITKSYYCPHYNEEERKSFDEFVISKGFNGLALEDDVALVYIDDEIKGVIKANVNNEGYYINNNFEKAYEIIMESMGSHFDPSLEEVFVKSRDKLEAYYSKAD